MHFNLDNKWTLGYYRSIVGKGVPISYGNSLPVFIENFSILFVNPFQDEGVLLTHYAFFRNNRKQ